MEGKLFKKITNTVKKKFQRNPKIDALTNEYAFSSKELDELNKNNREKIKELKKNIESKPKEDTKEIKIDPLILNQNIPNIKEDKEDLENDIIKEMDKEKDIKEESQKTSFLHLEKEYQEIIMKEWKEINEVEIEKDILEGKDLANHNYTITYADDTARFIHNIRKKYEIVICYLIGFNNEKKGISEKTYFSDNPDNEWKYLNYYIKLLEKIKNFKIN